jgi:hypothetical protein
MYLLINGELAKQRSGDLVIAQSENVGVAPQPGMIPPMSVMPRSVVREINQKNGQVSPGGWSPCTLAGSSGDALRHLYDWLSGQSDLQAAHQEGTAPLRKAASAWLGMTKTPLRRYARGVQSDPLQRPIAAAGRPEDES